VSDERDQLPVIETQPRSASLQHDDSVRSVVAVAAAHARKKS
jgi:hypothetical protein